MRSFINNLGNLIIKPLLRSPLHFFASGSIMLVTFTGRKSGKIYTTPVQYIKDGITVTFFTQKDRLWWKNLTGDRPVTLRLKGHDIQAVASRFEEDEAAVTAGLRQMYPRMSPEYIATTAPKTVMIQFELRS